MKLFMLKKSDKKDQKGYLSNPMADVNLLNKTNAKAEFYMFLQELNSKIELGELYSE